MTPPTSAPFSVRLTAVILTVSDNTPHVLTVTLPTHPTPHPNLLPYNTALPFGPLDPQGHRTLERALRHWVFDLCGIELGYVEQLYTFGDRFRDPSEHSQPTRTVSVAYLALTQPSTPTQHNALWKNIYDFFPWEDWRAHKPPLVDELLTPSLLQWAHNTQDPHTQHTRSERVDIAFGLHNTPWDPDRVLERYELLYETHLITEAHRDPLLSNPHTPKIHPKHTPPQSGHPMHIDHRRILAAGLGRLRGKIRYRPVVFELLPQRFTLSHLQHTVEALNGLKLHKQNFRRLVEKGGLVEGTGTLHANTGGRPAELFQFRREVLRERPAPGVGLPGARRAHEN